MARVNEAITVHAPADVVWQLAGDPGRIGDWLPTLAGSSLDGNLRSCTTETGGELVERITEHSDEGRHYAYEILESPLPVRSYSSRFEVHDHGDHSHISWTAEFEPTPEGDADELGAGFAEIYRQGLESIREATESRAAA